MDMDFKTIVGSVQDALFFLPTWASAAIIVVGFCAIALYLHALALRLIRRSWSSHRFVAMLLMRGANPTRIAILLIAIGIALPISGFSKDFQNAMIAPLSAAFILLIGWSCVAAAGLAGDLYLGRFQDSYADALTRKHVTQVRLLRKAGQVLIWLIAGGGAMMTIPAIRQYGVSLFASAGAAGIVVGLAARPLLSNLLAGIQIAVTQPVKIEDSVVINGEWGWVEDITSTYLVVRCWDWRRLIVPLAWFLEQPIQNWTRESATIIGTVLLYVDYRAAVDELRREVERIVQASKLWDKNVVNVQVVDATPDTMQIRILATAGNASQSWDLRCEIREKMIGLLRAEHPDWLPLHRLDVAPMKIEEERAQRKPAA